MSRPVTTPTFGTLNLNVEDLESLGLIVNVPIILCFDSRVTPSRWPSTHLWYGSFKPSSPSLSARSLYASKRLPKSCFLVRIVVLEMKVPECVPTVTRGISAKFYASHCLANLVYFDRMANNFQVAPLKTSSLLLKSALGGFCWQLNSAIITKSRTKQRFTSWLFPHSLLIGRLCSRTRQAWHKGTGAWGDFVFVW